MESNSNSSGITLVESELDLLWLVQKRIFQKINLDVEVHHLHPKGIVETKRDFWLNTKQGPPSTRKLFLYPSTVIKIINLKNTISDGCSTKIINNEYNIVKHSLYPSTLIIIIFVLLSHNDKIITIMIIRIIINIIDKLLPFTSPALSLNIKLVLFQNHYQSTRFWSKTLCSSSLR